MADTHAEASGEPEPGHFGYEVEYVVPASRDKSSDSGVRKCSHPSARDYSTQSEVGSGTQHPTLIVYDEDDDPIASYNGMVWIAIRKLAGDRSNNRSEGTL